MGVGDSVFFFFPGIEEIVAKVRKKAGTHAIGAFTYMGESCMCVDSNVCKAAKMKENFADLPYKL